MRVAYCVLLLLLSSAVCSQSFRVKGKVVNDKDIPLHGVSVYTKDSRSGTTSDASGTFSLSVPRLPVTLVFAFVGFEARTVNVALDDSTKAVLVKMKVSGASLDEVVVTGYGAVRRHGVTGSPVRMERAFTASTRGVAVSSSAMRKESYRAKKGMTGYADIAHDKAATEKYVSPVKSRARILTAGELSDFKKWGLWTDYTADEFKVHSRHWGMKAKDRYCVQLQNENFQAIAGQRVYLFNSAKDTVWSAVTDNTGKAELWAAFDGAESAKNETYTIVCGQTALRSPASFENGINRMTLKQGCTVSNIVDIAFVVDATGSMGDEIHYLQEELADVTGTTAARFPDVKFRLGSVFYRDRNDEYLTRHLPLQEGSAPLIDFIKKQAAGGGGDFPEALDEAMATALDSLQWSTDARARLLFLVLDAPPHDEAKTRMANLIKRAALQGIRIIPVVCSGIDKSTEYLMRCIALATNGSYVFLTDDSGIGNAHLKPTTDEFKVELLNALLQRLIHEMSYLPACSQKEPVVKKPAIDSVNNILRVVLFPNPTAGKISLTANQALSEIYLADFTGKVLRRFASQKGNLRWETDLSNYPSGTYLVKYLTKEKGWGSEKIVLVH